MLRTTAGIEVALGFISALAGLAGAQSPFHGVWDRGTIERHREPLSSAIEFGLARVRMDGRDRWLNHNGRSRSRKQFVRLERGLHAIRWRLVDRDEWEDEQLWNARTMARW